MGRRRKLQDLFLTLTPNVYWEPPESVDLVYDCIIFQWNNSDTVFANNKPYHRTRRYQVQVITTDPDSDLPDKVEELPMCTSDRNFVVDGLHHYNYFIYY